MCNMIVSIGLALRLVVGSVAQFFVVHEGVRKQNSCDRSVWLTVLYLGCCLVPPQRTLFFNYFPTLHLPFHHFFQTQRWERSRLHRFSPLYWEHRPVFTPNPSTRSPWNPGRSVSLMDRATVSVVYCGGRRPAGRWSRRAREGVEASGARAGVTELPGIAGTDGNLEIARSCLGSDGNDGHHRRV